MLLSTGVDTYHGDNDNGESLCCLLCSVGTWDLPNIDDEMYIFCNIS